MDPCGAKSAIFVYLKAVCQEAFSHCYRNRYQVISKSGANLQPCSLFAAQRCRNCCSALIITCYYGYLIYLANLPIFKKQAIPAGRTYTFPAITPCLPLSFHRASSAFSPEITLTHYRLGTLQERWCATRAAQARLTAGERTFSRGTGGLKCITEERQTSRTSEPAGRRFWRSPELRSIGVGVVCGGMATDDTGPGAGVVGRGRHRRVCGIGFGKVNQAATGHRQSAV